LYGTVHENTNRERLFFFAVCCLLACLFICLFVCLLSLFIHANTRKKKERTHKNNGDWQRRFMLPPAEKKKGKRPKTAILSFLSVSRPFISLFHFCFIFCPFHIPFPLLGWSVSKKKKINNNREMNLGTYKHEARHGQNAGDGIRREGGRGSLLHLFI